MAQMQAGAIIAYARAQGSLPTQNAASDTDLLAFLSTAQKDLAMEIRQPGAIWYLTTVPQANAGIIPEYRLAPFVDIKRVTLNGMLLYPTRIPDMEGAQIQLYDASSSLYQPQWQAAAPQTFPPGGASGLPQPVPVSAPWVIGARPNYYIRDNSQIGFVPPPFSPGTVVLDVITMPQTVTSTAATSPFDDLYLDALAWRVLQKAHEADAEDPQRAARADRCQRNWLDALGRIHTFVRMSNTGNNGGVVPMTVRGTGNIAPATYPLIPGQ